MTQRVIARGAVLFAQAEHVYSSRLTHPVVVHLTLCVCRCMVEPPTNEGLEDCRSLPDCGSWIFITHTHLLYGTGRLCDYLSGLGALGMHRLTTQREPRADHSNPGAPASNADWESIRIFLEIVRSGSLRAAADRLGMSFSAVRRRVVALERSLGTLLMTRHTGGIRLTAEGERIAAAARQMEIASHDIARTNESISAQISGNVKISATEGTGTFWLIPRLVEIQRAYPRAADRFQLHHESGRRLESGSRRLGAIAPSFVTGFEDHPARPFAYDALCRPILHRPFRFSEKRGRDGAPSLLPPCLGADTSQEAVQ